jgi:hypothetical protein
VLPNAGKMPALLEAGASRMPASRSPKVVYKAQGVALGWHVFGPLTRLGAMLHSKRMVGS